MEHNQTATLQQLIIAVRHRWGLDETATRLQVSRLQHYAVITPQFEQNFAASRSSAWH